MVKVDEAKCIGCGKCASVCPVSAISVVDKKAQVDERLCIGCGSCVSVCPVGALSLEGLTRACGEAGSFKAAAFPRGHFCRAGWGRGKGRGRKKRGRCGW
ncbi:MAG: 4Fe-4S dicluster domain-containing protein [Deferribacteres bacterium]|nr:4Fe-4S dicluster domain-containing protein [Deferribacteres bacterium]